VKKPKPRMVLLGHSSMDQQFSTKSLPTKVEDRHDLVPTATVKRQQSHPFSFSCPFNPGPVAHSCRVNPEFYGLVHFRAIWLQKLGLLW